jgi:hypothetical protein
MFSRAIIIFCLSTLTVCLFTCGKKEVPTPVPGQLTNWQQATPLDGGAGLKSTVIVPAFDQWYVGTTEGLPNYYTVNVEANATYEIYWDDLVEGSAKYSSDIVVWVFKMDGKTKYDSRDSGYKTPLTLVAKETSINIIITSLGKGTYDFGYTNSAIFALEK